MQTQLIITTKEEVSDSSQECPRASSTVTEAQARANLKWRQNNREKYNARGLVSAKLYYEKNLNVLIYIYIKRTIVYTYIS